MVDWVIPQDAIEALARRHDLAGRFADYEVCLRAAEETIMGRLVAGRLPTIASYVKVTPGPLGDEWLVEHHDEAVPAYFWLRWSRADVIQREADWLVGDFKFDDGDSDGHPAWGQAFDVRFDADSFPGLDLSSPKPAESNPSEQGSNRGRKPANWWPDFAEELAIYCLKEDPPEGSGTEGQSEMIDAIFGRMAARGKSEPSRTTVQPVINEILRRWRSAGN